MVSQISLLTNWNPIIFWSLVGIWLLAVAWAWFRRRQLQQEYYKAMEMPKQATIPVAVADQPTDIDTIGFDSVSVAIAQLFRNQATQAPYTLVLSGKWGSGKSSIMAQVRRKLCSDAQHQPFQHVWFNAWHFQAGDHLLASFLGSIFARCEEYSSVGFHARLLWRRFRSQGFLDALKTTFGFSLLAPLILYLLYALVHVTPLQPIYSRLESPDTEIPDTSKPNEVIALLTAPFRLFANSPELVKQSFPKATGSDALKFIDEGNGQPEVALWTALFTWGGVLIGFRKQLFSKESVLNELVPLEKFKLEAINSDPGFRSKYQSELLEVLNAAPKDTNIVVFIDDVDRISGNKVLELLESINFISDTASRSREAAPHSRLFFVLGMYMPEVLRTLSVALNANNKMGDDEAKLHALRYMEKLVDLIIPMPTLENSSADKRESLFFGESEKVDPEREQLSYKFKSREE